MTNWGRHLVAPAAVGLLVVGFFACTVEETDVEPGTNTGSGGTGASTGSGGTGASAGAGGTQAEAGVGGTSQDGSVEKGVLGSECASKSDCAEDLICLTDQSNDFLGGGPAHGFCTLECDEPADGGTDPCAERNAVCASAGVDAAAAAFCFPLCDYGVRDEAKCGGRLDVACMDGEPIGLDSGLCVPLCAVDADCTGGRVCDVKHGACVPSASASTGKATGEECTWTEADDECKGTCFDYGEKDFCSQRCVAGNAEACGAKKPSLQTGACALAADKEPARGDEARCAKFCHVADDCPAPGLDYCNTDAEITDAFGGFGICQPLQ